MAIEMEETNLIQGAKQPVKQNYISLAENGSFHIGFSNFLSKYEYLKVNVGSLQTKHSQ